MYPLHMKASRILAVTTSLFIVFVVNAQENQTTAAPADSTAVQPPAGQEDTLRARVKQYVEDCVNHKYRDAESLVGEESRDIFYDSGKPQYKSFDGVEKITWSENFTKAEVQLRAGMDMPMGSVTLHAHPLLVMDWHLTDGQWYVHIPAPQEGVRMPWGGMVKMQPVPQGSAGPPPDMPALSPSDIKRKADQILNGVRVDHTVLDLESTKPGLAAFHVTNASPGPITLQLEAPDYPGLSVTLDKKQLLPNEQAVATVRWKPRDMNAKPMAIVHVKVPAPLPQDITVQIRFSWNPGPNGSASLLR